MEIRYKEGGCSERQVSMQPQPQTTFFPGYLLLPYASQ